MDVIWIQNTDGKKDAMLTFSVVALTVVLIKVLLGGVPLEIFGSTYTLTPIDASTIGALLTPTLLAYAGRRYTDRKFNYTDFTNDGTVDVAADYHHLVVGDEDPTPRPMSEV